MAGPSSAKTARHRDRNPRHEVLYDREFEDLSPELRWREWVLRVEAVIFASDER